MEKEKTNKESSLQEYPCQTVDDIRKIIWDNKEDLAFIIGNGIDLYFNKKTSWKDLLLHLWNENEERSIESISAGISFTEFFDILELRRTTKFLKKIKEEINSLKFLDTQTNSQETISDDKKRSDFDEMVSKYILNKKSSSFKKDDFDRLRNRSGSVDESEISDMWKDLDSNLLPCFGIKKSVKKMMKPLAGNNKIKAMINVMQRENIPLLTTNFDNVLSGSIDAHLQKMQRPRKERTSFTDYYPWNCYYGKKILESPTLGFGIWHINGMIHYYRSIALGLCDYMGCVAKARSMIQGENVFEDENFGGKNRSYWLGYNTWLHVVFNKSLFIFGLALEENETFLRWLLIQRAKYFAFYHKSHHGWYVVGPEYKKNGGKELFLESVGFKIIKIEDYKTIYEDVWK